MTPNIFERKQEESDQTLQAVKEFTQYLAKIERDLSQLSKKFHTKETNRSVGFVVTGIAEARQYLEIVRKAVRKSQGVISKRSIEQETDASSSTSPGTGEKKNRTLVETLKGVEIWQGECENCHKETKIAFDGTGYRCADCLKKLKLQSTTEHDTESRRIPKMNFNRW